MSRESVDRRARAVTMLRSRAISKPVAKESIDFIVTRLWMTSPEILAHEIKPRVEQVECGPKRFGDG
jgi:hypothetical protein